VKWKKSEMKGDFTHFSVVMLFLIPSSMIWFLSFKKAPNLAQIRKSLDALLSKPFHDVVSQSIFLSLRRWSNFGLWLRSWSIIFVRLFFGNSESRFFFSSSVQFTFRWRHENFRTEPDAFCKPSVAFVRWNCHVEQSYIC
jgi:hypothetical protein